MTSEKEPSGGYTSAELTGSPEESEADTQRTRVGIAVAAIVIIGLVFLCFQFALRAGSENSPSVGVAKVQPGTNETGVAPDPGSPNPGSPNAGSPVWRVKGPSRSSSTSTSSSRPATVAPPAFMPPPPMPVVPTEASVPIFENEAQKRDALYRIAGLKGIQETAKKQDSEVFWKSAGGPDKMALQNATLTDESGKTTPLMPESQEGTVNDPTSTIVMAADSTATMLSLGAHPELYPPLLRADVRAFAYELRTYLRTAQDVATGISDIGVRSAAQKHLSNAGDILQRMESRAKAGSMTEVEARAVAEDAEF